MYDIVRPQTRRLPWTRQLPLGAWAKSPGNMDTVVPGFQKEMDEMLARAQKGDRVSAQFAGELKAAQKNAQLTQDQID
jgi:hypothetical protein